MVHVIDGTYAPARGDVVLAVPGLRPADGAVALRLARANPPDLILTDVSPIGPVLIMGAGSIGCYLGGRLALAGHDVHFVGRPRVLDQLRTHGLTITESDGSVATLSPDMLSLHEDVPAGLGIALVLMCVKSSATPRAATALARVLPTGTLVMCMQNGLHNAEVARSVGEPVPAPGETRLGAPGQRDQLYRISYDGSIMEETRYIVMGGATEPVASSMEQLFVPGWALDEALVAAERELLAPLSAGDLEPLGATLRLLLARVVSS